MTTLTVGSGQQYATIAAAVNASGTGDTIEVQAGTYTDDWLSIDHDLTLTSVGGWTKLVTDGAQPPDGKAYITESGNVTISGFDVSGVSVPDNNGAAIRYQGGNLVLEDVYFHDNQEGLLGAADPNGTISIDHSEFAFNGDGSGSTHDIYVGAIAAFTLSHSYIHDAVVGHEVKSRAASNTITDNRIFDNQGTASYTIDLPNGGNLVATGNVLEQGPNSENRNIFAYGEEGLAYPSNAVNFNSNTIVNDRSGDTSILNPTGVGLTSFANNSEFNLTNPLGATVLVTRPTLDLSPIAFLAGSTPPPGSPPPPPTSSPPPPTEPPSTSPPPLSPLDQYHLDVQNDFNTWAVTHPKLATMAKTLGVLHTEVTSTTVLGIIHGDHWSIL
jgi:hypothetical protein